MKSESIYKLNEIITRKTNELGIEIMKLERSGNVVSMLREDWHLFLEMPPSPIVSSLPLQMTIYIEDEALRMLLFPSPVIIDSRNTNQFIQLSNTANCYLYRGSALGRFWVDVDNRDFAYELILKEELLESYAAEIENQLFNVPLAHFKDLHIPLLMLAENVWKADVAISYLTELVKNGYVDNSAYGLW